MNTFLNSIISIILVAMLGFYSFSFLLSVKRKKMKEHKKITEKFVLPYLNDVLLFIEMESGYLIDHGVNVHIKPKKIISKLEKNISYGNAKIMNALYRYRNSNSYFDGEGEASSISIYEVFFVYLEYAYNNLKKTKYGDDLLLENIVKNQKVYGIAFVLTTILGKEEALSVLNHKWLWTKGFLEKLPLELLSDLINHYNNDEMDEKKLLTFLSTLQTDLFDESADIEHFANIKEYIDEAIVSVKARWLNYSS